MDLSDAQGLTPRDKKWSEWGTKGEISGDRWLKREEKGVKWGIELNGGLAQKQGNKGKNSVFGDARTTTR